jgi:hypothetical protein
LEFAICRGCSRITNGDTQRLGSIVGLASAQCKFRQVVVSENPKNILVSSGSAEQGVFGFQTQSLELSVRMVLCDRIVRSLLSSCWL